VPVVAPCEAAPKMENGALAGAFELDVVGAVEAGVPLNRLGADAVADDAGVPDCVAAGAGFVEPNWKRELLGADGADCRLGKGLAAVVVVGVAGATLGVLEAAAPNMLPVVALLVCPKIELPAGALLVCSKTGKGGLPCLGCGVLEAEVPNMLLVLVENMDGAAEALDCPKTGKSWLAC
jgi:hypothetical protein